MEQSLVQLIQKVGDTAPYAWAVLVRGEYTWGWISMILSLVFMIIGVRLAKHCFKLSNKAEDSADENGYTALYVIFYVVAAIALCIAFSSLHHIISPEYYVIHSLMKAVK